MSRPPAADAPAPRRALPASAFLLPLASGVLLAAAAPPAPSPVVPFLALVPLALFVAALPPDAAGALWAASGGFAAGLVQHAWGLRWLPGTLGAVAGRAVGGAAFVAVVLVLGALTALACVLLHALVARDGGRVGASTRRAPRPPIATPLAVALPVVWSALEWALAHLPLGLAFPWAPLGLGLARWPEALGIAELAGVGGVTLWLAAVNGLFAQAVLAARASGTSDAHASGARASGAGTSGAPASGARAAAAGAGAVALAVLPVLWGGWRARSLDAPVVGRAAAIALDVATRARPLERAALALAQTEAALADVRPGALDLIVLPEMALPLDPTSAAGAPFVARLRERATALGAPVLVGALGVEGGREYNSALLVERSAAPSRFRADKRHLVPGVERATAVHAAWLAPQAAGYAPGTVTAVARLGRIRVGALLCYDVAFAEDARALARGGADALAALTGDDWFGEGGARAAGVAQQLAHLTLRAIETRRSAVRASSGGPAVILGPTGREEARAAGGPGADSAAAHGAAAEGPLRAVARPTLFVRTGDLAGPSSAAVLTALLLLD